LHVLVTDLAPSEDIGVAQRQAAGPANRRLRQAPSYTSLPQGKLIHYIQESD
jgi:hypothetical protein